MKVNLQSKGAKVTSIGVVRETISQRILKGECTHNSVDVNTILSFLVCNDCGEKINPIEWIASMMEGIVQFREKMIADYTALEEKRKKLTQAKCHHCGRITPVLPTEQEYNNS